jgi:hypothetical protein
MKLPFFNADRRRLRQFSLKTLLLLCACCGILLAWVNQRVAVCRDEQAAKLICEKAGAYVENRPAWPSWIGKLVGSGIWQDVIEVSFDPRVIDVLSGGNDEEGQIVWGPPRVNDETLRIIGVFSRLERLSLHDALITDDSMKIIANSKSLRELSVRILYLRCPPITDRGVEELVGLGALESLDLTGAPINDRALVAISHLRSLRNLRLLGTDISDDGLQSLAALRELRSLDVSDTRITEQGARRLALALPKCEIDILVVFPNGPRP